MIQRRLHRQPKNPPAGTFPVVRPSLADRLPGDTATITWMGHATVLVQAGGLNVLTDPMWSKRASPVPFGGPKRLVPPPLPLEALPPIDVVLLSHNHYDHLDRTTVRHLVRRFPNAEWLMPLGLARLLRRWGAARVRELDWWAQLTLGDVTFGCVPAQHFSARGLGDRGETLWCGWSIAAPAHRILFAGDTAYHPEFERVGRELGPFDVLLLPIGAYEPRWFMRTVHMNPEDALKAYQDLTRNVPGEPAAVLPIHWGTFRLTDERMDEPPARFASLWKAAGLPDNKLWIVRHGESRRAGASQG